MNKLTFIKVLFMAFLPFVAVSCNQSAAKRVDNVTVAKSTKKADSLNKEFLPSKEMRIGGKLPMESRLKSLKGTFGKPDSTVTPDMNDVCASYYDKKFDRYYVKGLTFEKYNDTVVFSSVDYGKGSTVSLWFGKLKIDKNTSLDAIKKLFPVSGAEVSEITTAEGTYNAVRIAPAEIVTDDSFLLLFDKKTGMLVQFSYYMPC